MYTITRQIGIDAGHRVMTHGSKCRHIHGHRYTIEATCEAGELINEGVQQEMVLDFGFLKNIMIVEIDVPCDHSFIIYVKDPILFEISHTPSLKEAFGKLYIAPFIPTAEKLAEHWYNRMLNKVIEQSECKARLLSVTVYETPNCKATYNG